MWKVHFNRHLLLISSGVAFKCRTIVGSMLGTISKMDFVGWLSTMPRGKGTSHRNQTKFNGKRTDRLAQDSKVSAARHLSGNCSLSLISGESNSLVMIRDDFAQSDRFSYVIIETRWIWLFVWSKRYEKSNIFLHWFQYLIDLKKDIWQRRVSLNHLTKKYYTRIHRRFYIFFKLIIGVLLFCLQMTPLN